MPASRAPSAGIATGVALPLARLTMIEPPCFARHSTHAPSSASCAGPSAHGKSVSVFELPSSTRYDHVPPRSASSTVPPASVRNARTEVFAGSVASSVSPLPRRSVLTSDVPRANTIEPVPRSSSALAMPASASTIAHARIMSLHQGERALGAGGQRRDETALAGGLERHDVAEPRKMHVERATTVDRARVLLELRLGQRLAVDEDLRQELQRRDPHP